MVRWFILLLLVAVILLPGCPKPNPNTPTTSAPTGAPTVGEQPPAPPPAPETKPAAKPASGDTKEKTMGPKLPGEEGKSIVTTATGLKYIVLTEGTGAGPKRGDTIIAEYTGWLTDGTKFDSSKDHPGEFSFAVGTGRVIPGWDEALLAMKEGETRKLIIPSELAYGERGAGGVIPPNATLVFEVKLVKVVK